MRVLTLAPFAAPAAVHPFTAADAAAIDETATDILASTPVPSVTIAIVGDGRIDRAAFIADGNACSTLGGVTAQKSTVCKAG